MRIMRLIQSIHPKILRGWDKTKIIIFLLEENDDFLRIRNWFPFQGRFPRARLQANRTLVRKTLSHDVTILVFLPFREGAKKMDFPLVLFPQESPLHYNQFIKYQIFNMAIYHKQRNLYLCLGLYPIYF